MKVYHVDWSPDGKYVAFSRGPHNRRACSRRARCWALRPQGWNICVGNVATGEWAQITTDGNCNKEPDWAPLRQSS